MKLLLSLLFIFFNIAATFPMGEDNIRVLSDSSKYYLVAQETKFNSDYKYNLSIYSKTKEIKKINILGAKISFFYLFDNGIVFSDNFKKENNCKLYILPINSHELYIYDLTKYINQFSIAKYTISSSGGDNVTPWHFQHFFSIFNGFGLCLGDIDHYHPTKQPIFLFSAELKGASLMFRKNKKTETIIINLFDKKIIPPGGMLHID